VRVGTCIEVGWDEFDTPEVGATMIERSKEWWLAKAKAEGDAVVTAGAPINCKALDVCRDTGAQRECGKVAICIAYGDLPLCDDCCHEIMQDASPEEQSTVVWLDGRTPKGAIEP
jgi:hypothetical protein